MLFVNGTHLSGSYEGIMLVTVVFDVDNHIFDVTDTVVGGETKEDWFQFLSHRHECLGGLKPIVMPDHDQGLLAIVPAIFG